MNLKELIEKATPLPWVVGDSPKAPYVWGPHSQIVSRGPDDSGLSNPTLAVHAVNILPELVEALERATGIIEDLQCPADYPAKDFRALLKKATTINIKQKGN